MDTNQSRNRVSQSRSHGDSSASSSHSDSQFRQNPNRSFRNPNAKPPQNRDSLSGHALRAETNDLGGGERVSRSKRGVPRYCEQQVEDLKCAASVVGTCPFMCPDKERVQRERLRDLAVFERLHGNPGKSSSSLAVKKFCRTITSKNVQASDIRPLPVLEATLKHLLEILDSSEHPFEVIHDFVFDRTRSIRQDLGMQIIVSDEAIWMFEKMVSFHVISHHRLHRCNGNDPSVASMQHLNIEQLTKTLVSLYNLYDVNRNSDSIYRNEAEFHSLYVLLHLGAWSHATDEPLSLWFRHLPSSVIKSKRMAFARKVLRAYRLGNYWRFFFTIAEEATYLEFCVLQPHVDEVRVKALACINHSGYKLHPYPLTKLSEILRMQEADMESLCNACGLETFRDDTGSKVIASKQTSFLRPRGGLSSYEFHE